MAKQFFHIENGVPIPSIDASRTQAKRRPFKQMKIGDSFYVPGGTPTCESACAGSAGRTHGAKFIIRQVNGGIRVWRIE